MPDPTRSKRVLALHRALAAAAIPHAIGGAVALGHYGAPRPTKDIDVNVFVPPERRPEVRRALDPLRTDGDPIHVFYSHDELHEEMAASIRWVEVDGTRLPLVAPEHLIVRKALLDRPKDWVDIEAMLATGGAGGVEEALAWVRRLAGEGDRRVGRLEDVIGGSWRPD